MRLVLTASLWLILVANLRAEIALGHRDFYPSPDRPIRYRGDGNGCFPGATPVTEWWVGTPGTVVLTNAAGQPAALPVVLDTRASNIVWSTSLPGPADAQPIVIGDRLVSICDPDYVVCLDARSGRVLWQDRVGPLTCDGLPAAEAARRQEAFDIARAVRLLGYLHPANQPDQSLYRPAMLKSLELARARLGQVQPQFVPALEQAIATVQQSRAENSPNPARISLHQPAAAVAEAFAVPALQQWDGGYVTKAACTPVSDGWKIWVTFGHGQTACYDLNGNRLWATRVKSRQVTDSSYYANPLLCGRVLIVSPLNGRTLYGYDADTGAVRWQVSFEQYRDKDRFVTPQLARLPLPDGQSLDVLVTANDQIIRVSDGVRVGQFPATKANDWAYGRGLDRVVRGNQVLLTTQRHVALNYGIAAVFTLAASNADTVTVSPHYLKDPNGQNLFVDAADPSGRGQKRLGWANVALSPTGLLIAPIRLPSQTQSHWDLRTANLWDLPTGQYLGPAFTPAERPSDGQSEIYGVGFALIGQYLMSPDLLGTPTDSPYPAANGSGRRRPDQFVGQRLTIVDLSQPRTPRLVPSNNLLGTPQFPRSLYFERYFKEAGIQQAWCCGQVFYSGFGLRTGGPTALGNRLFVQSATHLYCIGDPSVEYDWNPASRPPRIAQALIGP